MLAVAVVAGIGIAVYFLFLQGDSPTSAPPPPQPPPTTIPTTTTVSECQTRWAWLADDRVRYFQAKGAMRRSGEEVEDTVGDEALYAALDGYVLDYEPAPRRCCGTAGTRLRRAELTPCARSWRIIAIGGAIGGRAAWRLALRRKTAPTRWTRRECWACPADRPRLG